MVEVGNGLVESSTVSNKSSGGGGKSSRENGAKTRMYSNVYNLYITLGVYLNKPEMYRQI